MTLPGPYCPCCGYETRNTHADGDGATCDECRRLDCAEHCDWNECLRFPGKVMRGRGSRRRPVEVRP